jgi:hypothetical protein
MWCDPWPCADLRTYLKLDQAQYFVPSNPVLIFYGKIMSVHIHPFHIMKEIKIERVNVLKKNREWGDGCDK